MNERAEHLETPLREPHHVLVAPDNFKGSLTAELAGLISSFAKLLKPADDNDERLQECATQVRAAGLPHLHSFTRGLDQDPAAVTAVLTKGADAPGEPVLDALFDVRGVVDGVAGQDGAAAVDCDETVSEEGAAAEEAGDRSSCRLPRRLTGLAL